MYAKLSKVVCCALFVYLYLFMLFLAIMYVYPHSWGDWAELMSSSITCLFCSHTSSSLHDINGHMTVS